MERRKTRSVKIGNRILGSGHDILIQSMTYTKTEDKEATLSQILSLEKAGCEIVRFSVPNEDCVKSIPYLKEHTHIPLVADIHFDYRLALLAAERGIDKIRINPGNIGSEDRVKAVAKYGAPTPEALCESAFFHVRLLEKFDFNDIIVSIKSSDVASTIKANKMFSEMCDYPLHLGVTEAGTERSGLIKSSAGIGALLCEGIGDTLRVSLSDDVIKEVEAAKDLLRVLDIRQGVKIVSCPTCSRCNIDVFSTAKRLEEALKDKDWNLKIAVMGCAVNGPGEAREADIGIAGGVGEGLLFKKGETVGKVPMSDFFDVLMREAEQMANSEK